MSEPVFLRAIQVPMRDGVSLKTDVYLPNATDRFPCILIRSPYNGCAAVGDYEMDFVRHGLGFIKQDCRGTGGSEGDAVLWSQEKEDSEDFLLWLKDQPWFNGNLVTNGESYPGHTQWQLARTASPLLKGITVHNAPMDLNGTINYHNGAMALSVALFWGFSTHASRIGTPAKTAQALSSLSPLRSLDVAAGIGVWPLWRKWVDSSLRSPFTEQTNILRDIPKITAPAYVTAGWFDAFLKDSLRGFSALRSSAASREARSFTRLCVEPLDHDMRTHEVDYGPNHLRGIINVRNHFMDGLLHDPTSDPIPDEPIVTLFLMGSNRWITSDSWPLPNTQIKPLYLAPNASLSFSPPSESPTSSASYSYDPTNPTPTCGGNNLGAVCPGQRNQASVESRSDLLLFTSPPLQEDLHVVGNISATLFAASSAFDTDFTIKLCDVFPNGSSFNVADGIVRARYRNGDDHEEFLSPNSPTRFEIDLWATATTFLKGHQIRIQVASANFPRFDANPNTRAPHGTESSPIPANQTVFFSPSFPSHISLPIVDLPNNLPSSIAPMPPLA